MYKFSMVAVGVVAFCGFALAWTAQAMQEMAADNVRKIDTSKRVTSQPVATDGFMKQKLKHSTSIVEGLATDDLKKIGIAAEKLLLLSHEADWNALKTPAYLKMSDEFRSSVKRLRKNADDKNLDGATLAYFEVTINCVRCHKHVRANQLP